MTLTIEALVAKLKEAETGAAEAIEVQAERLRQLAAEIDEVAAESHKIKVKNENINGGKCAHFCLCCLCAAALLIVGLHNE